MHARIYDFTLGANGMQRLAVVGDFFKVVSSLGAINVNVDTGASLDVLPGQGLREFPFNTLVLTDKSGAANSGKILVGFSGVIDDRVTGEVSIIDGAAATTRAGNAFFGALSQSASVGLFGGAQLWNPVGSGKRLIVRQLAISGGALSGVSIKKSSVALLNAVVIDGQKMFGGAAGVAQWRRETGAVEVAGANLLRVVAAANALTQFTLREPVIVPPGAGITGGIETANAEVTMVAEYVEEAM